MSKKVSTSGAVAGVLLVAGTLANALTTPATPPAAPPEKVVIKVCQSPGCLNDGAKSTLEALTALAPPGVTVEAGGCVSLCGSGPVVEALSSKNKKFKKVKDGEKWVSLLDEYAPLPPPVPGQVVGSSSSSKGGPPIVTSYMRDRLLGGYEIHLEANEAYAAKEYQKAVDLYDDAIQGGRKMALALQEARDHVLSASSSNDDEEVSDGDGDGDGDGGEGYPPALEWLVTSFRNSCRARLALKDTDGARRDAFAATVFTLNTDAEAHECLAEVCAASGDAIGERQAVKAAIGRWEVVEEECSRPMPGEDAVGRAANAKRKRDAEMRKRELGFRLRRLERELSG